MDSSRYAVLTVGHSNHSSETFIKLLIDHGVETAVDVRSAPYSRFSPQFNREQLKIDLKAHDMGYVFLGRELGARSKDPSHYDESGRVLYSRLAKTGPFRRGLDRVVHDAAEHRVALMCSEGEPLACHRTLLVSRALVDDCGIAVEHILPDGGLESYDEAMDRLLLIAKRSENDFFLSRRERIAQAMEYQQRRVAYNARKPAVRERRGMR